MGSIKLLPLIKFEGFLVVISTINSVIVKAKRIPCQWRANPNQDLDLNPDLTTFAKSRGFGLDLNIYNTSHLHLDLSFLKEVDLGFGFEDSFGFGDFKSTFSKVEGQPK